MKQLFLSIFMVCSCLIGQAQTHITTNSIDDTNGNVNTENVANTTSNVLGSAAAESDVTAEQLNTLLSEINAKLQKLSALESRLSIVETKMDKAIVHEYVDLGLSVKWATCNIGATQPEDCGSYFAWGMTTGYGSDTNDGHSFDWENYKWMTNGQSAFHYCTKYTCADGIAYAIWYNNDEGTTYVGTTVDGITYKNKTVLDKEDDAASGNWGGNWRMPTSAEMTELREKCKWTWTNSYGVYGYKVTSNVKGYTDKYIFLPAGGYRYNKYLYDFGSYGSYLSSSLYTKNSGADVNLDFNASSYQIGNSSRFTGCSVRPVCQ